jgi:hypothetical protein
VRVLNEWAVAVRAAAAPPTDKLPE